MGNSQSRNILRCKCLGLPLGNYQSSLRDSIMFHDRYPGLASWAKFSRPFGTKFPNPEFSRDTLKPNSFFHSVYGPTKEAAEKASVRRRGRSL